jgi:hypothetical protein
MAFGPRAVYVAAMADKILDLGFGFWGAKTLLSAVELKLFTRLGDRALTGLELTRELGLHDRANPDFYDALVALGMLERDGEGPGSRYRNTPDTATFLDETRPEYVGGILEMLNARLWTFWGDLTEGLRTGQAQNEVKTTGAPLFEALYRNPESLEQFLRGMRGVSAGNFRAFAEKFDFSTRRTMCDVGGATGQLSVAVASRHRHMKCHTVDLPPVAPIATRWVEEAGLSDRVTVGVVDFFRDSFPEADVVTMGMILHDWNLETKQMLIAKAFDAVPKGGAFVVIEHLIDDARRQNAFGLLMSLNMLIETGDGFDYTGADFDRWCREAGFARTEVLPLTGHASAAIAHK